MPFKILLFRCQLQSSPSSLITHRPESDQHPDLFAFLPACSGLGHHWSTAPALPLPRPYPAVPGPSSKTKALILAHPTRNLQRIDRCMTACSIIGPHSQLKLFQILWRSLNDPNGQLPNTVIRHSIRVALALITHPHLVRCTMSSDPIGQCLIYRHRTRKKRPGFFRGAHKAKITGGKACSSYQSLDHTKPFAR